MMEARFYEPLEAGKLRCNLCSHRCVIPKRSRGICKVRENQNQVLVSLVYDKVIARHVDPIEKKPLFHFYPGSLSYSIATAGCNFKCQFCQNADIAQLPANGSGAIYGEAWSPEQIVNQAQSRNCRSIAYTYTEPTIYFELAFDTARIAHQKGLKNVFVTNGYMTPEVIENVAPYLDAANVDLKAFTADFYKTQCQSRLEPVKESLRLMKSKGILVEVTTLLIPGLNDNPGELKALAAFLVEELGPDTPWHVSRFHPTYRLTDRPPTPPKTLYKAREIGIQAGLRYVYTGNLRWDEGEHTYCHGCGQIIIERSGFSVGKIRIVNGVCDKCGTTADVLGV